MDDRIGVIGAGSWGTTLAKVAADNERDVLLWTRRSELARAINTDHENQDYLPGTRLPDRITATDDLESLAANSRLILLVVPSHGLRKVAHDLGQHVTGEHIIVHATKGIEQGSHLRMTEVLREETCVKRLGVLSGPNLAKELAQCQPTGTLIASRYHEVFERCHAVFNNAYFRVYWGEDVVGAEVGGAFKNIVALAAGVVTGLGLGENTKALLLTRGLSEMARFGTAMGAQILTFGGMAGMGDLIATCASPLSRNHQVGARLAKGEKLEAIQQDMRMVAEGVKTTFAVHQFATEHQLDLPIVRGVYALLYEGASVPDVLRDLMALPTGEELAQLGR